MHEPVLCEPVMSLLAPQPGELVVDATIGHGGHAQLLAGAIGPAGRLIGLDVDAFNLSRVRARLEEGTDGPRVDLVRANFRDVGAVLDVLGVARVDILLADLGVSTDQLLAGQLGLSFTEDEPLDMRLDDRLTTTAADLVNGLSETELSDLIFRYSQERHSRRIAKRICQARRGGRIRRTSELVRLVCSAAGASDMPLRGRIHPATRTFLALRIAVNDELGNVDALLSAAPRHLSPGGRIGVISFHSGEDRIVKRDFLDRQREGVYEIRTKKPIHPSGEEIRRNPKSRSAKLRVAVRASQGGDAA